MSNTLPLLTRSTRVSTARQGSDCTAVSRSGAVIFAAPCLPQQHCIAAAIRKCLGWPSFSDARCGSWAPACARMLADSLRPRPRRPWRTSTVARDRPLMLYCVPEHLVQGLQGKCQRTTGLDGLCGCSCGPHSGSGVMTHSCCPLRYEEQ